MTATLQPLAGADEPWTDAPDYPRDPDRSVSVHDFWIRGTDVDSVGGRFTADPSIYYERSAGVVVVTSDGSNWWGGRHRDGNCIVIHAEPGDPTRILASDRLSSRWALTEAIRALGEALDNLTQMEAGNA
jgi:hypothetical protein